MSTLSKLQRYMTGRKALLPVSLFLSAMSALAGMAPYILVWFIIREFITTGAGSSPAIVQKYAWWAAALAIGSIAIYFLALSASHLAAFRVECNMRRSAMNKLVRLPLGFFDNNTTGRIRKIIDENAGITHGFLAHQMPDLAGSVVMPFAAIVLIFVFDWRLGLACIIPLIISMLLMGYMMGTSSRTFMQAYMNSLEEMNSEAVEYVRGIPVVKVFQQTVFSFKNFHDSIVKYREMVIKYTKIWKIPMSVYTVVINGFTFFLVPAAILLTGNSGNYAMPILNMFLYILITPVFSQSIMKSMYITQALGQAKEAIDRLENLTSAGQLAEPANPQKIKSHDIQFKNVSFSYPGANKKAVDNVSFTIPGGKTVALVGASGGGKTTIARLVPRFWDVDEGEVCIGNVNVKDIAHEDLMNHVSFVFQNTRLFKTTLLENIKYGNPNATMEEVNRAVDLAQCREIINSLPDGLNTKIGTEGTYLSGGEQQRIALARAFLKNAPIVLLDEATAFTDPENEHLIQQALKKLAKGKTVLMIAHRLTSVMNADNILVISEGKIAEQGTHQKLLQKQGIYTNMWNEYQQSVNWTIGKEVNHA
ncbi:ABC transporter ATP-binding protein [Maribellus maritimus]|uniref:ABC transporter ATP-binding protein n=1 Tax=Maribellus maritimus TaxID=2870838 RepID=UPI001EEBDE9B|nr:ABC transporter ATP-binding protein [Maribellus maritimus]MCG6190268.1 ABC transporter ATP-binding protein/permease [Maribellus maritimus]